MDAPDRDGKVLLDVECELIDLVRAVNVGAREVLETHGADGYQERWVEHAFPQDDLVALERWSAQH